MRVISSTADVLKPTAIALGNFDGIHLGHQRVLQPILAAASRANCLWATVVTFSPHPKEFFTGQSWQLLTPLPEKREQLEKLGVQQLVLLPFARELAALNPQQFVEQILVQQLQARKISVGQDFRFGHRRAGTAADLQAIACQYGVEVTISSLQTCSYQGSKGETERISSSSIRQALARGDIPQANRMLGRTYNLRGEVVKGEQLGRQIGFPTANLALPPEKLLPRQGVYSVQAFSTTGEKTPGWLGKGVMNVGCRPTVDGKTTAVEVHLLDWSGDLYGQVLTVSLQQFLRPERKFSSLAALKSQIAADCEAARQLLSSEP